MQIEITAEQIRQVRAEWADIQRSMEARRLSQAEYTRYYTFHHLLEILGLVRLIEGE